MLGCHHFIIVMATALRKAGIKNFRFHDCRHTFASQLVLKGVPLRTVAELLGHSDIRMTQRYSHIVAEHVEEAVEKLDSIMDKVTNHNILDGYHLATIADSRKNLKKLAFVIIFLGSNYNELCQ